jgi:hypothetical protein
MSASFDYKLRSSRAQSSGPETAANHLTEHAETPQEFFRFSRAGDRYTASVEPEITAKTSAPPGLVTVCTQPGGRRA